MSASVAGPSAPSQLRDWLLPVPQEISVDDSFSTDLIRQFDKKRSRLRVELKLEQHASDSDSVSASRVETPKESTPSPPLEQTSSETPPIVVERGKRRRSAGDLLRRSSAFLRAKIEALRGPSRSHDNLQRDYHEMEEQRRHSNPPPSKLVVNTTIAIPQFSTTTHHGNRFLSPVAASIQPPVITQYPPKPLKYSPVEPVLLEEKKSLRHRISMPALRNAGGRSTLLEPRRRSDVGVERMGSIGRRARKALGSCAELRNKAAGTSRKGKERATGSPASTSSSSSSAPPTTTHGEVPPPVPPPKA
ncbi:hypothetical protein BJV82DRAFT_616582 [Fennellomyces sp. T-0311]|nr:hypothetical protein BJV82DRAFT_616582 [Fennellomyces sp. T-0311]